MSSTSVLSSASNATVNVFDTIGNTAMAATKIVNGIATGGNMFERMMNDMDANHAKRSKINQEKYEKELLEDAAMTIAKRQAMIQRELADDPIFANLFAENYAELKALLNPSVSE
ncbi:UNVERIFIED_ORG: hypothetical protein BCL66_10896 [Martelella mediterranea]